MSYLPYEDVVVCFHEKLRIKVTLNNAMWRSMPSCNVYRERIHQSLLSRSGRTVSRMNICCLENVKLRSRLGTLAIQTVWRFGKADSIAVVAFVGRVSIGSPHYPYKCPGDTCDIIQAR